MLGLVACAQTTATKSTEPRQETDTSSPVERKAPSESAESEQTESGSETPAGGGDSALQETETPPAAGAEPDPLKTDQRPAAAQPSTGDSADAKLAQARENLRISQETENRIADELEQLKRSGSATEETVRDYETYLKSVEAMTAENRKIVEQMEAALADNRSAATDSGREAIGNQDEMSSPAIPEEQMVDEVAELDRQLDTSLAKFDGMLLQEMEEIRAESSGKLNDLAQEAAGAAKRLREKGLDVDTSGSSSSGESRENPQDRPPSGEGMESSTGGTGNDNAAKTGSQRSGEGRTDRNQSRANYEDDDIVARQLREAAENETDPELKEKLWKEYEEYKKSQ